MHYMQPSWRVFCPVWVFKTDSKASNQFSWLKTAYHYCCNLNSKCLKKMSIYFLKKKKKIYKLKQTNKTQHTPQCFLTISAVLPREIYSLTIPFHFFPKPWREVPFSGPISFTPDSVMVQHTSKFEEVDESILNQLCFNEALQFSKPSHKILKRKMEPINWKRNGNKHKLIPTGWAGGRGT